MKCKNATGFLKQIKGNIFQTVWFTGLLLWGLLGVSSADVRHRLIVLADMGNEPDEMQQMVHMITCSNEFDIEGLIAVTGIHLRPEDPIAYQRVTHPELFLNIIDAYEKDLSNLKKHACTWPDPNALRQVVVAGQKGYGIDDVGQGKSSPGSELIIKALTKNVPRPVWIVVNAGSNCFDMQFCLIFGKNTITYKK